MSKTYAAVSNSTGFDEGIGNDANMVFATVTTYAPTRDDALAIAWHVMRTTTDAASAHIEEVESLYRWDGELHKAIEWRVSFDVADNLADDVAEAIRKAHPYELPAITKMRIDAVGDDVASWMSDPQGYIANGKDNNSDA